MPRNKPRKWSNLKGQLPEETVELTAFEKEIREDMDALQAQYGDVSMQDVTAEFTSIDEHQAVLDEQQHRLNVRAAALERLALRLLDHVKAVSGSDMYRSPDGHTFSPRYQPNPKVTNPAALMQWLEDTGRTSLLTLPRARLKSIVGEALDTEIASMLTPAQRAALKPGEPASSAPPPGVEVKLRTTVHRTTPYKRGRRKNVGEDNDE